MAAKKNKKIQWWQYAIASLGTAILTIITFKYDNSNDDIKEIVIKIGLLSTNISFLFIAMYFFILQLFEEQKSNIEESLIAKSTIEMTYKKILDFEIEDAKEQYKKSLEKSLININTCIDEKRSGELESAQYYRLLELAAEKILNDKNGKNQYSGEIWSLTFGLIREWDKNVPNENAWFRTLTKMDGAGIKTRRLWVFDEQKLGLNPLNDYGKKLLDKVKMYCSKDSPYKNTESYAISNINIKEHKKVFGNGFFAIKLTNNTYPVLIYGVAKEKVDITDELCGEIDYDVNRKNQIRKDWEHYWNIAERLIDYLKEKSDKNALDYMKTLDFKI